MKGSWGKRQGEEGDFQVSWISFQYLYPKEIPQCRVFWLVVWLVVAASPGFICWILVVLLKNKLHCTILKPACPSLRSRRALVSHVAIYEGFSAWHSGDKYLGLGACLRALLLPLPDSSKESCPRPSLLSLCRLQSAAFTCRHCKAGSQPPMSQSPRADRS